MASAAAAAGAAQTAVRQASVAAGVPSAGSIDRTQSRKLVLVSIALLTVINVYRGTRAREEGQMFRRLWGTGVLGVMLSLLADFAPQIAGPFALLTVLGSFTNGGDEALQQLFDRLGAPAPAQASPSSIAPRPATAPTGPSRR